jgi:hypothetical protein
MQCCAKKEQSVSIRLTECRDSFVQIVKKCYIMGDVYRVFFYRLGVYMKKFLPIFLLVVCTISASDSQRLDGQYRVLRSPSPVYSAPAYSAVSPMYPSLMPVATSDEAAAQQLVIDGATREQIIVAAKRHGLVTMPKGEYNKREWGRGLLLAYTAGDLYDMLGLYDCGTAANLAFAVGTGYAAKLIFFNNNKKESERVRDAIGIAWGALKLSPLMTRDGSSLSLPGVFVASAAAAWALGKMTGDGEQWVARH